MKSVNSVLRKYRLKSDDDILSRELEEAIAAGDVRQVREMKFDLNNYNFIAGRKLA